MQKERKTLVMRVGRSHEGFMFVFSDTTRRC